MIYLGAPDIDPALGLKQGTVEAWREGMVEPCEHSDFLVFAASVPAAGPLLEICGGGEGALFHLHGSEADDTHAGKKTKSTSGKTTSLRVAASAIGRCRKSDLVSFNISERGLDDYCAFRNNLAVFFDEEGRGVATGGRRVSRDHLPYIVASGRGTFYSAKASRDPDLQNLTWLVIGLSTGENPLDDDAHTSRQEGAQVRMLPVPVPPGGKGGIFNRLQGSAAGIARESSKLIGIVEETIAANYGVLMPAYLAKLVPGRSKCEAFGRHVIAEFIVEVGAEQDPWEGRFASRFGVVLVAALLLAKFKLAPWTEERARAAIRAIYEQSRAASIRAEDAAAALVHSLKRHLAETGRFPVIEKGQTVSAAQAAQLWGVIRTLPKYGRVIAVDRDRLRDLIKPATVLDKTLRWLVDHEVVLPGRRPGVSTRQVMIGSLTGDTRPGYVLFREEAVLHFG